MKIIYIVLKIFVVLMTILAQNTQLLKLLLHL